MPRNPLSAAASSDAEPSESAAPPVVRSRDSRDALRVAVELTAADSLEAFQPESVSRLARRPRFNPASSANGRRRAFWKRLALAAVAATLVLQSAAIAWWLGTGTMPWAAAHATPVAVTSDPEGAPVIIDGVRMGTTPVTSALPPGPHTVVVGEGARAQTQHIEVQRGTEATVHVALAAAPAAAPPVASTGELRVSTEPPGAEVVVDGQAHGASPVTIDGLAPGRHEVTVTRAGVTIRRSVEVEAGAPASVIVSLGGGGIASGWLTVVSPVVADLFENGTLLGRTNTPRLLLPVGGHELDIVDETLGYRVRRTVQITGGSTTRLQLEPVNGLVNINAQPWAEVWIDGVRVGETPVGNLSLPIGFHDVVLRHPQLGEQRQTVAIGVGTPARIGVDLRR
ncbi:MAG TPA: PEGA domain-containing protein [Vicinamibacterales bacterium]|nr:PEGA domain-containing protein [Vicinamibacterales bacterium]